MLGGGGGSQTGGAFGYSSPTGYEGGSSNPTCDIEPLPSYLAQGDPCYWDALIANDCAGYETSQDDCLACYFAGQPDPNAATCGDTDCGAYLDCLSDDCSGCEDEYMYFFICKDKYFQCGDRGGVECSVDGYNTMAGGFRRGLRIDHHHGRGLGKHRKGTKNSGSKPK